MVSLQDGGIWLKKIFGIMEISIIHSGSIDLTTSMEPEPFLKGE
jgi:hypothetical protein